MIRIEVLKNGVLVIHGRDMTSYVDDIDNADAAVMSEVNKLAFKKLRALDPGNALEGVGCRVGSATYYIFTPEDDDFEAAMEYVLATEFFISHYKDRARNIGEQPTEGVLNKAITAARLMRNANTPTSWVDKDDE